MRNLTLLKSVLPDFQFRIIFRKSSWFTREIVDLCGHENLFIEGVVPPETLFHGDVRGLILTNAQANLLNANLIEMAHDRQIPVIAIEEVVQVALNAGMINSYLLPVDYLLLASANECAKFTSLGIPENRLYDVGWAFNHGGRLENREAVRADLRRQWQVPEGKQVATLFLSQLNRTETRGTLEMPLVRRRILELVRHGLPEKFHLVIKLHPIEDPQEAMESIRPNFPHVTVICGEIGAGEVLAATDVCLNRGNSQVVLEALLQGIPVAALPCGMRTIFDDLLPEVAVSNPQSLFCLLERYRSGSFPDWGLVLKEHHPRSADIALERMSHLIREFAATQKLNAMPADWLDLALYRTVLGDREGGLENLEKYVAAEGSSDLITPVEKLFRGDLSSKTLEECLHWHGKVRYRWPLMVNLWIMNQTSVHQHTAPELRSLFKVIEEHGGFPPIFNPYMFVIPAIRLGEILTCYGLLDQARIMTERVSVRFCIRRLQIDLLGAIALAEKPLSAQAYQYAMRRLLGLAKAGVTATGKRLRFTFCRK